VVAVPNNEPVIPPVTPREPVMPTLLVTESTDNVPPFTVKLFANNAEPDTP
jgi:hypothetical protein